ncbi:MAG: AraC family transcriptional regulator [Planctomycetota bacterium]|nr:MAG: AraC family transcriptional regulator [Planctomycetota bacterium]
MITIPRFSHGRAAATLALALAAAGCRLAPTAGVAPARPSAAATLGFVPDLPVSSPPFRAVHTSWKQRLDQPYVYLEHRGSYTGTGALLATVHREMIVQGLEPSGPPFALFYDDPAQVPVVDLHSRACMPVAGVRAPQAPLAYEVLPSQTVVYAYVSGPYPEAPRAYPGLFAYLAKMGWLQRGPVREIYLVPPTATASFEDLIAEIQLPATSGP